jgi:mRNA interferase ChpB
MAAYVPDRGDIIHLQFDPASGHEMKGPHYGLVVSAKQFNKTGLAMVCPVSQGIAAAARTHGMLVSLMGLGIDTQGAIHCHQMKSLDWKVRKAKFKEKVPGELVDDVVARIEAIIS